jgi:hypothetical protein
MEGALRETPCTLLRKPLKLHHLQRRENIPQGQVHIRRSYGWAHQYTQPLPMSRAQEGWLYPLVGNLTSLLRKKRKKIIPEKSISMSSVPDPWRKENPEMAKEV